MIIYNSQAIAESAPNWFCEQELALLFFPALHVMHRMRSFEKVCFKRINFLIVS